METISKYCFTKQLLTIATVLVFLYPINAQQRDKSSGLLFTPDVFSTYCKKTILDGYYQGESSLEELLKKPVKKMSERWVVHSDRSNNTVYEDSRGNFRKDKVRFMEPLGVLDIEGLFIKIAIQNDNYEWKYLGWIHVNQVVLSPYAMIGDKGIPKKAMALISFQGGSNGASQQNLRSYKLYSNPDLSNEKTESGEFNIYYVMKETKGGKLLSKTDVLTTGNQTQLFERVSGWMANFYITNWDNRVCLEESYSQVAAEQYGNYQIPIFPTKDRLDYFINSGTTSLNGSIMRYRINKKLPPPTKMRMPILNVDGPLIKEIATVGSLKRDISNEEVEEAELKQKLIIYKKKQETINIVFIVDATQSMKSYYEPIADAISSIIQKKKLSRDNTTIKFGFVAYKDYPDGDEAVLVEPLGTDGERVIRKIKNTSCGGVDNDLPEALYNGLIKGINNVGFKKNESNIVVLIGDAGNHRDDIKGLTTNSVVEAFVEYDINLMSFQVIYGRDNSYSDFNREVKIIMRDIGKLKSPSSKVISRLEKVNTSKNTYKLVFEKQNNSTPASQFAFGRFTHASDGIAIDPKVLELNLVEAVLKEYLPYVNSKILAIEKALGGVSNGSGGGGVFDDDVKPMICEALNLTPEQCNRWFDPKTGVDKFSYIGYTSTQFYSKNTNCFEPVIFVSEKELDQLSSVFDKLKVSTTTQDQLNQFKLSLLSMARIALGIENEKLIEQKTMNEIWEILMGTPFDEYKIYGNIGKTKLKDLDKVPKKDIQKFFALSRNSIERFNKSRYNSRRLDLNGTFFWIPLIDIPGNEK